jgi:acyl-activating enzyme 14
MNLIFHFSDWYLEWLLAIAFVGGIAAPLNYRWVSKFYF